MDTFDSCKEILALGGAVGTLGVGAIGKLWMSLMRCQGALDEAFKRSEQRLDALLSKLRQ